MLARTSWPRKSRELHNHHMDSTVWNDFVFRRDDIIVGTYAKSGTTWTQQIVGQLLSCGSEDIRVAELSPWLDMRILPRAETLAMLDAQRDRRFIKTHLPVDALVFSPEARYLYIARDGRDVVWSLHNHLANATDQFYQVINDTPGRVGPALERPPTDIRAFFLDWLERDGHPLWSFWENIASWWDIAHLPNVKLLHFADLKRDLEGEMRGIADFLDIAIDESRWPTILEHCGFDYMKANAAAAAPLGGALWEGGASTFINRGNNGRWRDVLTVEDNRRYEAIAREQLGEACVKWLACGEKLPAWA
ncbi:MAG: sulfotransferase domain-containing protein [Sphingomonadaceae bacterium]|nr:sulfotransferase domain-containing protein [Sphingomonadaceae bacterium]